MLQEGNSRARPILSSGLRSAGASAALPQGRQQAADSHGRARPLRSARHAPQNISGWQMVAPQERQRCAPL